MSRAFRLLVAFVLVLAACGGDDDAVGDSSTAAPGDTSATTAAPTAAPTTAAPVVNPTDDFCVFVTDEVENVDLQPLGLTPGQIEEAFTNNVNAINQALSIAPNELQSDVQLFADAFGGLNDLLAENDYNFLALADPDLQDPRLDALDDPALVAAGDRIADYCDLDEFVATAPAPPPGGGGGVVIPGSELPDDFPSELVPPGGVVVSVVNAAGVQSVTFDIEAPTDDIIAFYTDELGPPVSQLDDGALWIGAPGGSSLTLTVADTGTNMTQVNVTIA